MAAIERPGDLGERFADGVRAADDDVALLHHLVPRQVVLGLLRPHDGAHLRLVAGPRRRLGDVAGRVGVAGIDVQRTVEEVLRRLLVQPVRLLVGVGDADELEERQPVGVGVLAVGLDLAPVSADGLLRHQVAVVGQGGVDEVVLRAEVPRLHRSATGDPDRRVRLLQRPRQHVHVTHLGEPSVEGERLGGGPCPKHELDALEVLLAQGAGIDAVGVGGVHRRADGEPADQPAP